MAAALEQPGPAAVGHEYMVLGVLERKDRPWTTEGGLSNADIVECTPVFKQVLNFKPAGGWVFDPKPRG